jgi:hypothetical protein
MTSTLQENPKNPNIKLKLVDLHMESSLSLCIDLHMWTVEFFTTWTMGSKLK